MHHLNDKIFDLFLYVSVNSYGHVETVSSPNHTFSWASLTKQLHILLPVTDINSS